MTPADFIKKWGDNTLRERQGAQEHFIDLCRLLGEPIPAEDDPFGERYCFKRGAAAAEPKKRTLTNPYNARPA